MTKRGRKKAGPGPRNAWDATVDAVEDGMPGAQAGEATAGDDTRDGDRTQAGEVVAGDEAGGGGDKGFDMETGDGGYGGDAVDEGRDAAGAEPDRPTDVEVRGDPRTRDGDAYPDVERRPE